MKRSPFCCSGVIYFQQSKTKRSAYIILNGNSYGVNSKQKDKTVWICTSYRKTKCKARVTTTKNIARLTDIHNHEPNYLEEHDLSYLPHKVFTIFEKYKTGS